MANDITRRLAAAQEKAISGPCPVCGDTVKDIKKHLEKSMGDKYDPITKKWGRVGGTEPKRGIIVSELIRQLRQLVLEHPHAVNCEVVLSPHGHGHRQHLESIHFNIHETKVVLESER